MTNPIAGNQFYTGMSTLAEQLPQLNVGDLKVAGDLTVAGAIRPGTFTSRVVAVTASAVVVNLTPSDSGTTYALTQTGVAQTINLPAPSVSLGVKFKFVNVANAGANIAYYLTKYSTSDGCLTGGYSITCWSLACRRVRTNRNQRVRGRRVVGRRQLNIRMCSRC